MRCHRFFDACGWHDVIACEFSAANGVAKNGGVELITRSCIARAAAYAGSSAGWSSFGNEIGRVSEAQVH